MINLESLKRGAYRFRFTITFRKELMNFGGVPPSVAVATNWKCKRRDNQGLIFQSISLGGKLYANYLTKYLLLFAGKYEKFPVFFPPPNHQCIVKLTLIISMYYL